MEREERVRQARRVGAVLRKMCEARDISPTGEALWAHLHLHLPDRVRRPSPGNLRRILKGEVLPHRGTLNIILEGLDATTQEKRAALGTDVSESDRPESVDVVESLMAEGLVDKGRVSESVLYRYVVGTDSLDNKCTEVRRTRTTQDGMELLSTGPGQRRPVTFDLQRFWKMHLTAEAKVVGPDGYERELATSVTVGRVEVYSSNYQILIGLDPPVYGQQVETTIHYLWPGLWDDLRSATGRDTGGLHFKAGGVEVTLAAVEVWVPTSIATPKLSLTPVQAGIGKLSRRYDDKYHYLRWQIDEPPEDISYVVTR